MDEWNEWSAFTKVPVYQFETEEMIIKEAYLWRTDTTSPGRGISVGEYTVYAEGYSEMTLPIPVSKCVLDPRKKYALRISVFEVT
jgi:hypothetical protein